MGTSRRRSRRIIAILAVAVVFLGVTDVALAGGREACVPGAPGVGDAYYPTYGNGGYDVRHYGLQVAYDPATDRLDGRAEIRARATQSLCSFNLDLVGLEVRKVEVDGKGADWTRSGQELVLTPRRALKNGRRFEVEVRYDGVPVEFSLPGTNLRAGFLTTADGVTVVGAPEVAAAWYPVNDHPIDKASYTFEVTVPLPYEVVANGFLRDVDSRRQRTTWEWRAPEPMASYLATIDIGFWDVHRWRTAAGIPVYDAVDSAITGGLRERIDSSLARQGDILDFLADAFGRYPFRTVGGIVEDDRGFAMETQTRPVYRKGPWVDPWDTPRDRTDSDLWVVHELAHQWFGDDVALAGWQDVWLNEGFATYAEWLWEEHEGWRTPQAIFQATYDAIPASNAFWSVVIGDPTVDFLFDNAVYVRGAMTLQALRNEVGDDAFWAIIRGWASTKSGGNGTTEEFVALAERVSGRQLDELFDTWLFTPARPDPSFGAVAPTARGVPSRGGAHRAAPGWLGGAEKRLRQLHEQPLGPP
jgi:aminopeptidase N